MELNRILSSIVHTNEHLIPTVGHNMLVCCIEYNILKLFISFCSFLNCHPATLSFTNSFNSSLSNCIPLLLQRLYNNIVKEIHIKHVGNLNTKSCTLLYLDLFCCPSFIKPLSNRTSCANNVVINYKLLSNIFYSNIFIELTCNNTLIGLEVKS